MSDEINEDDEIIQDFLVECGEHLDILDNGLVLIEQDPSDKKILSSIFRSIHTIKGGSGMLAFNNLERLTHSAENLLSLLRDGKLILTSVMITELLNTVDAVREMLQSIGTTGADGTNTYTDLIGKINLLIESPIASSTSVSQEPESVHIQQVPESDSLPEIELFRTYEKLITTEGFCSSLIR